jgi:hypothetical protein
MRRYLRNASPETYFVASAIIGALLAAVVSRFSWVGLSFLELWGILLSADLVSYVAMKAGWIRPPRERG